MTNQLPPQDPREPDEKLPGEAELAALYRQLPHSEPAPALDAAVLRAAARALASDGQHAAPERRKSPRERGDWVHPRPDATTGQTDAKSTGLGSRARPRWLIALSSAATLVLAAGLAWHMRELPPVPSTPAAMDSAAPAQATAAAPLPRAAAPAAATQSTEPAPPPPMEPSKQPPPKMVVAASRTAATNSLRKTAADQRTERASSKAQVAGGLTRFAPAPAAAPAAPPATLQETASNSAMAKPPVAEAATEMPAIAPAPAAFSANDIAAPNASDTPAQELDKIQQLFKHGHDDEARQRLTAFQRTHPQWKLPPELRAQLRKP